MKKRKLGKKISLNKETVVRLGENDMNDLQGGATIWVATDCICPIETLYNCHTFVCPIETLVGCPIDTLVCPINTIGCPIDTL